MKSPSLWKTVGIEVFSIQTIILVFLFAALYLFTIQLLLNYKLLLVSFSQYSPPSILYLLYSLLLGSFTSISAEPLTLFVLLLNALLVGLNIVLLGKAFLWLRHQKRVHVTLGGAALFSLVTAGCASCGLSLISVLGLSATLAFLPLHGAELRVISLILLVFSAFYMLKKLHEAKYCRI